MCVSYVTFKLSKFHFSVDSVPSSAPGSCKTLRHDCDRVAIVMGVGNNPNFELQNFELHKSLSSLTFWSITNSHPMFECHTIRYFLISTRQAMMTQQTFITSIEKEQRTFDCCFFKPLYHGTECKGANLKNKLFEIIMCRHSTSIVDGVVWI